MTPKQSKNKNKFTYSLKEGEKNLYLYLNFDNDKWSFKAIDKASYLAASVTKGESVKFVLSLESDSETVTSSHDIDTTFKTTLKY